MSSDDELDLNEITPIPARTPLKAERDVIDLTDETPNATPYKAKAQWVQPSTPKVGASSMDQPEMILSPSPPIGNTLVGLNRRQMEEERLARRKRKAPSEDTPLPKLPRLNTTPAPPFAVTKAEPVKESTSSSMLRFADGEIRTTHVRMVPRQPTDITIEEIFDKDNLQDCVLSAFQWDIPWVLRKLGIGRTKLWFVMHARANEREHTEGVISTIPNAKCIFPSVYGIINCMHSKLQLLFFDHFLRVVVPSANLVPYDWGETSAMENMVFIQDFLWVEKAPVSPFFTELCRFCRSANYPPALLTKIAQYDMSTAKAQFVHSVGGAHTKSWDETGLTSLARAVNALAPSLKDQTPQVDIITSSCGSLSDDFCGALYQACTGYPDLYNDFHRSRTDKNHTPRGVADYKQHMRVYFPSRDTVINSLGGRESGGTVCFNPAYWKKDGFPRAIIKSLESVKPRTLMHSKAIYIRSPECNLMYMGSANMSESAWGKLVLDRQTKEAKLNVRNWECGVVLKVDGFGSLQRYKSHDNKPYPACGPWFFQELR